MDTKSPVKLDYRASPAKIQKHSARVPSGFWDQFRQYAFVLVSLLILGIISYRIYMIIDDVIPGLKQDDKVVASFRFDDNFDSLTAEKKQAYLNKIAEALGVDKLDVTGFRRGSVIVDVKVPENVAERIAKDKASIGESLEAEVEVEGYGGRARSYDSTRGQSSSYSSQSRSDGNRFFSSFSNPSRTLFGIPHTIQDDDLIVLQSGDHIETDRGLFALAKVSGLIFHDINANGIFDPLTETGVENVKVLFVRATGEVVAERFTDRSGQFHFSEKEPGDYFISIEAPSGRLFSPLPEPSVLAELNSRASNSLRHRIIKSEVDPAKNGNSSIFSLHSGSKSTELNAGIYGPAQIGGFVWEDILGTGKFDSSVSRQEYILNDATVELLMTSSSTDSTEVVASQPITANGRFSFENVIPGTYSMRFSLPAEHYFVLSTLNTGVITLSSEGKKDVEIGFYRPVSVRGSIFEDLNALGWVTGKETEARRHIRGATVRLIAEDPETRLNNKYLRDHGHPITSETQVSQNGDFEFDGFAPGRYHLHFLPPNGYKLSKRISDSQLALIRTEDPGALRSDADSSNGFTPTYLITSGSRFQKTEVGATTDINVCMYTLATIGGYVWEDLNADGIFDEDFEHTLEGVEVHLLNGDGEFVAKTTTNDRGHYIFKGLEPGRYSRPRIVPPPNHQLSNARTTFKYVTADSPRLMD